MYDLAMSFLGWFGGIIESFFPWAFVTLLVLFLAVKSETLRNLILEIIPMFRRIKIGIAEFELTDETRMVFTEKAGDLNSFISSYRDKITKEIKRHVEIKNLDNVLENCVETYIIPNLPNQNIPENFRCTVHVEDFLLKDWLYQLVDYYPSGEGTAGRVLSIRYGVIGKAYRSGLPQVKGDLLGNDKRKGLDEPGVIKTIALEWGLTIREARNIMKYPSYCAIPLQHQGRPIGVFYMDSTILHAFSAIDDDPNLIQAIKDAAEKTGLAEDIAEIISELKTSSAKLEIP